MSSLAEALAEHGPVFLSKFQNQLPVHVERVISLITRCRTARSVGFTTSATVVAAITGSDEVVATATVRPVVMKKGNVGSRNNATG